MFGEGLDPCSEIGSRGALRYSGRFFTPITLVGRMDRADEDRPIRVVFRISSVQRTAFPRARAGSSVFSRYGA